MLDTLLDLRLGIAPLLLLISPHSHTRLYIFGNHLMRSDDRGETWTMLSGDLTRNLDRDTLPVMGKVWGPDAVGKNLFTDSYGTGTSIAESPLKEGLLVLGTDDGLIQITEDGGAPGVRSISSPACRI